MKHFPSIKNCLRVVIFIDLDSNTKHSVFLPWETSMAVRDRHVLSIQKQECIDFHQSNINSTYLHYPMNIRRKWTWLGLFKPQCKHSWSWKIFWMLIHRVLFIWTGRRIAGVSVCIYTRIEKALQDLGLFFPALIKSYRLGGREYFWPNS